MIEYEDSVFNIEDPQFVFNECSFEKFSNFIKKESPMAKDWVFPIKMSIENFGGTCKFLIDFHSNKDFYIREYLPSSNSPHSLMDIQIVSSFFSEKGWNGPNIMDIDAKDLKETWKKYWEVGIIKCNYYDKHYKKR